MSKMLEILCLHQRYLSWTLSASSCLMSKHQMACIHFQSSIFQLNVWTHIQGISPQNLQNSSAFHPWHQMLTTIVLCHIHLQLQCHMCNPTSFYKLNDLRMMVRILYHSNLCNFHHRTRILWTQTKVVKQLLVTGKCHKW